MIDPNTMTDSEFDHFRTLIYDSCGINFTPIKKQLLITRLRKRMVALGIDSFSQYRKYVSKAENRDEFTQMLNAVSTNKTDFFRESVHFHFLGQRVYPQLLRKGTIRVWSAASSSGEEVYTLAMTLLNSLGNHLGKDIKILGTDISTKVLEEAERGIYTQEQIAPIPATLLQQYFLRGEGHWMGHYLVKDCLKEICYFRRLNLMEPFPLRALFDFIFCRNVMIYFDKATRESLVKRLSQQLQPGGYLFIGNAESLSGIQHDLKYVQPAVYQKV